MNQIEPSAQLGPAFCEGCRGRIPAIPLVRNLDCSDEIVASEIRDIAQHVPRRGLIHRERLSAFGVNPFAPDKSLLDEQRGILQLRAVSACTTMGTSTLASLINLLCSPLIWIISGKLPPFGLAPHFILSTNMASHSPSDCGRPHRSHSRAAAESQRAAAPKWGTLRKR
jgi:hypothetical protein